MNTFLKITILLGIMLGVGYFSFILLNGFNETFSLNFDLITIFLLANLIAIISAIASYIFTTLTTLFILSLMF